MIRIVKMHFEEGRTETFTSIYSRYSERIAAANGCRTVRLLHDRNDPCIFFTISEWESEKFLDDYRNSGLFKEVWSQVKPLFAKPAEAWSTE